MEVPFRHFFLTKGNSASTIEPSRVPDYTATQHVNHTECHSLLYVTSVTYAQHSTCAITKHSCAHHAIIVTLKPDLSGTLLIQVNSTDEDKLTLQVSKHIGVILFFVAVLNCRKRKVPLEAGSTVQLFHSAVFVRYNHGFIILPCLGMFVWSPSRGAVEHGGGDITFPEEPG